MNSQGKGVNIDMDYRITILDTEEKILKYQDILDRLDKESFPEDDIYHKIKGEGGHRGRHVWWLVKHIPSGEYVGFAGIKLYNNSYNAFMVRVGISPKHQRRGLHSKLLKKRIDYAIQNRVKHLYTYTSYDNYISANNLVKFGFKLTYCWFDVDKPKNYLYFIMTLR